MKRRKFIQELSALAGTTLTIRPSLASGISLFVSDKKIKFGYAAITWGGDDLQAIKDISELGFKGIQFRASIFNAYKSRPQELRDLLAQHKLEFVALSSGSLGVDPTKRDEEIRVQIEHAKFMRQAGGLYLQLTDSARPKTRNPEPDDYRKLGQLLSEIGKQVADFGIQVGYHNHMGGLGEKPEEVDQILAAADPRYVKLELDSAHYLQGGGDPATAIRKYRDRLLFLHVKDVENLTSDTAPGTGSRDDNRTYRFVELGRGRLDFQGFFKALREVKFSGWAIVELDTVPSQSRSPKGCGMISKSYLEKLGFKI